LRHFSLFALKRLAFVPAAVLIVVTLSFFIVNFVPSDPAREKSGGLSSEADVQLIRHQLGLDKDVWHRFWDFLTNLFTHGSLGRSYYSDRPVWADIGLYLPSTIELIVLSLFVATVLGVGVGAIGAHFKERAPDVVVRVFITVTQAIPDFFLGLLLIFLIFYKAGWAPAPTGQNGLLEFPENPLTHAVLFDALIQGQWSLAGSAFTHAILPALTLGIFYSAYFAKTTRSVLGRAFDSYQVEFARSLGLPERRVLGYAFRQARTPIITYGSILFAALIGGAAIVETVFAWGGLGQFAIDRILHLDIPEVQGFIMIAGLFTLLVFLVLDILVIFLDPRVSIG
jgi:ABC-type dipeptide/oligopeptide/nickel transport system permease component